MKRAEIDDKILQTMAINGRTHAQIAKHFGVCTATIARKLTPKSNRTRGVALAPRVRKEVQEHVFELKASFASVSSDLAKVRKIASKIVDSGDIDPKMMAVCVQACNATTNLMRLFVDMLAVSTSQENTEVVLGHIFKAIDRLPEHYRKQVYDDIRSKQQAAGVVIGLESSWK